MPGKKLLVADDSLTIQKVIRLALSNEGYEIQAVSDGNDAIQQVSLFRPDVVLIDVSLPGKSAFEVKRAINEMEDLEEVRFVLMSSAFEKVDEAAAEEVRFHGRLTKPFDPAHLRQVLTDVLAQVTAKRMEKTSFLMRPNLTATPVAAAPAPAAPSAPAARAEPAFAEAVEPAPAPVALAVAAPELAPELPPELPTALPMQAAPSDAPAPPSTEGESIVADISEPPPPPPSETISLAPPDASDGEISLAPPDSSGPSITLSAPPPPEELVSPEWNAPITTEEPVLEAPPSESVSELWDREQPAIVPPPLPLSPPPLPLTPPPAPAAREEPRPAARAPAPPASSSRADDDIRHLTESTLRMSGMADEFGWSVKEPSLKPLPGMSDNGGSNFAIEPPLDLLDPPFSPERATEVDNPLFSPPPPPPPAAASPKPARAATPAPAPPTRSGSTSGSQSGSIDTNVVPVSSEDMEEMIRRHVREALEKMARSMLPELAERVIKDEIHKLLSEQP
jgi:CheY-like chemotaxis protein